MPIIRVEKMKIIHECKLQKRTKEKQTKTQKSCAFKLGFLKSICKASTIFKSHLKLALSIILKQRGLYESKHVAVKLDVLKYETCYPFWYAPQS